MNRLWFETQINLLKEMFENDVSKKTKFSTLKQDAIVKDNHATLNWIACYNNNCIFHISKKKNKNDIRQIFTHKKTFEHVNLFWQNCTKFNCKTQKIAEIIHLRRIQSHEKFDWNLYHRKFCAAHNKCETQTFKTTIEQKYLQYYHIIKRTKNDLIFW